MNSLRCLLAGAILATVASAQDEVTRLARQLADNSAVVRKAAADGLANLGPDALKAGGALVTALADKDAKVAEAAGRALGKIGKPAVKLIHGALQDRARHLHAITAVEALGADGAELVPAILQALQQDEVPEMTTAALAAVKAIGAPAVPYLRKALKARVSSYRAAQLLAELHALAAPALPDLVAVLDNTGELEIVRGMVATAIGRIGPDAVESVPKLLEHALAEKEGPSVRIESLRAIGWIGRADAATVNSIKGLLTARDSTLAASAKQVLSQLK